MKNLILIAIAIASFSAHARAETFTGKSMWYNSEVDHRFDPIETAGTVMSAVEEGLRKCHEAGSRSCVLVNADLVSLQPEYVEALGAQARVIRQTVQVKSVDGLVKRGDAFTETDMIWAGHRHSQLANLGARMGALTVALKKCYEQYDLCAVEGIQFVSVDDWQYVNSAGENAYVTKAEATVRGLTISMALRKVGASPAPILPLFQIP